MTTISSRLTSYQLSRKEHHSQSASNLAYITGPSYYGQGIDNSLGRLGHLWHQRGEWVIEGGSFHLLVLGMVTKPIGGWRRGWREAEVPVLHLMNPLSLQRSLL